VNFDDSSESLTFARRFQCCEDVPYGLLGNDLVRRPRDISCQAELERASEPDADGLQTPCFSRCQDGRTLSVSNKDRVKDNRVGLSSNGLAGPCAFARPLRADKDIDRRVLRSCRKSLMKRSVRELPRLVVPLLGHHATHVGLKEVVWIDVHRLELCQTANSAQWTACGRLEKLPR